MIMKMNKWLRFIFAGFLAFFLSDISHAKPVLPKEEEAAKEQALQKLRDIFQKSQTLADLVKNSRKEIDEKAHTFIREKVRGHEKAQFKFEKLTDKRFVIRSGRSVLSWSVEHLPESDLFVFEINGKKVRPLPTDTPHQVWGKFASVFPNETSATFYLLPEAHALAGLVVSIGVAGAVATFLLYPAYNCIKLFINLNRCKGFPIIGNPDGQFELIRWERDRTVRHECGTGQRDFQTCVKDHIDQKRLVLPADLRGYPGEAGSSDGDATATQSVK